MRYVLYQYALVFTLHREITLRDLTLERLKFRNNRGSALFTNVVAVVSLLVLRGMAPDGADALCGAPAEAPFTGAAVGLDVAL